MNIDEKLALNKFNVDEENAHILVDENLDKNLALKLCKVCSANLYKMENDKLKFDYAGCLECGTCKMISFHYGKSKDKTSNAMASSNNCGALLKQWKLPNASFGILFKMS
ncbi:ferredoxin family protein [Campylobacter jejuni]|uniref:ferredoxin family protein n=1 Tax=Campylobacter jejuni TaxID=197 RepID=UPI000F7FFF59|nr:ferredoxin family protein [Campylobacter jejuni]RTJ28330.1 ferredoxin family protein [Campylobacter jejuni]